MVSPLVLHNGQTVPVDEMPVLSQYEFRDAVISAVHGLNRVSSLFAYRAPAATLRLVAVVANDREGSLAVLACEPGAEFASMTPEIPQVHLFEREIAEQYGLAITGHPWLKPVRFHAPFDGPGSARPPVIGDTDFFRMRGEEVHEVAVGPVHAGVIEPGHFRFQCQGETVHHLEISLGYQHRGIEQALVGGPGACTIRQVEALAGDTTAGHTVAYCQVLESLSGSLVPMAGQVVRGLALELERCANHTGDLGALAGDVGYLPTLSFCGRIRGDFLNMTALLCGNRFARGLIVPGGVAWDLDAQRAERLRKLVATARRDFLGATGLLWSEPSVMARFEDTGRVSLETCLDLGLVGMAARACGCIRDVRQDFPEGVYRFFHLPVVTDPDGDVKARAYVRWREVRQSLDFIEEQLGSPVVGPLATPVGPLAANALTVSLVEGWRGEICHAAITDAQGRFLRYKVVDPSFHNWTGLAMALRGEQISDFPLCNKSFNLSYCGYDL